jgi:hypothetical protein
MRSADSGSDGNNEAALAAQQFDLRVGPLETTEQATEVIAARGVVSCPGDGPD